MINNALNGNWSLFVMEYKNEDVYQINKSGQIAFSKGIHFSSSYGDQTIYFQHGGFNKLGNYVFLEEKDNIRLRIYNATEEKFNDTFSIDISMLDSNKLHQQYGMELISDDWYIYGEKSVVNLMGW